MQKKFLIPVLGGVGIVAMLVALVSCGGTSGGDKDFSGQAFVADESVGSIFFSTLPSEIQVSRVAGFAVGVKNGNGEAVPSLTISCDTEQGLALIEPTSGREITDSTGSISGKVGCERPGSYQIGCRLPVGANKRVFERVVCTGEIPDTFTGFPGAGGGGLGGGSLVSDDAGPGGTSLEGFGIQSTKVNDGETEGTFTVDTTQVNTCGDDGTDTEPFGDASVEFGFLNETNSTVSCDTYTMTVAGVGTFGPIAVGGAIDGGFAPNGGEATITVPLAIAQGDGTKTWAGSATAISSSTGFKNVSFSFACNKDTGDASDVGEDVTVTKAVGVTFANVNRCETGGGGSGGGSTGDATFVSLSFTDNGTAGATTIDVTDTACSGSETESLSDARFTMTVDNDTGGNVTITSYSVEISGVGAVGTKNKTAVLATGTQTFSGLIALTTGSAKTTIDGLTTILNTTGNKEVTVTITGTDANGDTVTISGTDSLTFTEVDNCA